MKVIINRKLTGPGNFVGHTGTPAVGCSFKAAAGYLYPLERGFIYVHKPPIHIRFEEVQSVNFARGGGSTRSFDFEIELKSGTIHTFSSIEKEEYNKLFDFINTKKLHIKNRSKTDKTTYNDDFGDSDNEAAPDAYLERVKAEAQERDDDDDNPSDDESTDEDFNPGQDESDVAEEFDSNHSSSSEEEDDAAAGGGSDSKEKDSKHHHHRKEKKKTKTISEKPRRKREKKVRDDNKPKRPTTAFMIWLNDTRESIKAANPGIKVTEIAKKGGEMWKELKDKSVWEGKAAKAKEKYTEAMKEYEASGGASKAESAKTSTKSSETTKSSSNSSGNKKGPVTSTPIVKSGSFKSKEYIEESDSSSDDGNDKKKKRKAGSDTEKDKKKTKKTASKESGSEASEDASSEADEGSDSD